VRVRDRNSLTHFALCGLHELRPPLLADVLQLLILLGRQDCFHLRVCLVVYRLKPLESLRPGERWVIPDRLQLWLLFSVLECADAKSDALDTTL
jgi:hypothetical protein